MTLKHPFAAQAQTKLMNALFARELPKRYPGVVSVAAHPGVVKSDLFRDFDVGAFSYRPPDPFGNLFPLCLAH